MKTIFGSLFRKNFLKGFILSNIPMLLSAQINFSFEDQDLSSWIQHHDSWEISGINPISGDYSLHHIYDSQISGNDAISLYFGTIDFFIQDVEWKFSIRYDYTPSSVNYWLVYLASASEAAMMSPGIANDAYLLGVNAKGGDDILKLWRMMDGNIEAVITTSLNWEESVMPGDIVNFMITREMNGAWNIFYTLNDKSQGYKTLGRGEDNSLNLLHHFGVFYSYSSSQDRKLAIDNVQIKAKFIEDSDCPRVSSCFPGGDNIIYVQFNEPVQIKDLSFYSGILLNDYYKPLEIDYLDDEIILMAFRGGFLPESQNKLSLGGFFDYQENMMQDTIVCFDVHHPEKFDILITEIMADPEPPMDLPTVEYIELYNNSRFSLYMQNWKMKISDKTVVCPRFIFPANSYILIMDEDHKPLMEQYGSIISIESMPALNNSGGVAGILDPGDQIISYVSYSDDWYRSDLKAAGGWSLERIDQNNYCEGRDNWMASISEKGGTPGSENSVASKNMDYSTPELYYLALNNDSSLTLQWSEPILPGTDVLRKFSIYPDLLYPVKSSFPGDDWSRIILNFREPFIADKIYSLNINNGKGDCAGNKWASAIINFGVPAYPDSLDVVINEVLFNSWSAETEFIELYNRSSKYINAKHLLLAEHDQYPGEWKKVKPVSADDRLFAPGEYLVICNDFFALLDYYSSTPARSVSSVRGIISLNNTTEQITLLNSNMFVLDQFNYHEDFHFQLLHDKKGVSLERVNPDLSTQDSQNWHSASSTSGYATPGKQNSQYCSEREAEEEIFLTDDFFSPDNDGVKDVLQVFYQFDHPGNMASAAVFDCRGRITRYLFNQQLLETSGFFVWDGTNYSGQTARIGIYLIYVEVFDLSGNVRKYKKTCVLANQMR